MMKLRKSFSWARHGLRAVWREERNFRIETVITIIIVIAGFVQDLSSTEWALVWIAITFVLGAEILNTAVEDMCNKIEPKNDPVIGKIKDIMAGFVLVCCVASLFIGVIVFF